jgi:hypothetical protein
MYCGAEGVRLIAVTASLTNTSARLALSRYWPQRLSTNSAFRVARGPTRLVSALLLLPEASKQTLIAVGHSQNFGFWGNLPRRCLSWARSCEPLQRAIGSDTRAYR